MKKFASVKTVATPLDRVNVDTDQIIPKQFLKLVTKSGFGRYLFYDWRFLPEGGPDPDFVLNDSRYSGSKILATGDNFGCGSSREHAVWALQDFGFEVIISTSFADIFYNNCFKNGILPVRLPPETVRKILDTPEPIEVSLEAGTVTLPDGTVRFEIDSYRRKVLLEGLDDVALTLQYEDEIAAFEKDSKVPSAL